MHRRNISGNYGLIKRVFALGHLVRKVNKRILFIFSNKILSQNGDYATDLIGADVKLSWRLFINDVAVVVRPFC